MGKRTWGIGWSIGLLMMLGGDSAPDTEGYDYDVDSRDNRKRDCLDENGPPQPPTYYPLDDRSRAQGAEACLGPWSQAYGNTYLPDIPGTGPGMHKAHLLADTLGGHPIRENLVAFYAWGNLSQMKIVENRVVSMLNSPPGTRVYFQAIPVYTRPYHPRHQELGDAPLYVQYHIKPKNGPVYTPAAMNVA